MLTQLYRFQTTTGLDMASLRTGLLPKWTYLKENIMMCVTGPCTQMLPTNAEGNVLVSVVFIPHVFGTGEMSPELWELPEQEPGAGTLFMVLLHRQGAAAEESSLRGLQAVSRWHSQPGVGLHPELIRGVQKGRFAFHRQSTWFSSECKSIYPPARCRAEQHQPSVHLQPLQ